ncbi:MAG: efflux RND transporter periplasmic adaptor subunit [Gammaproteobacteria bacterium]|nr:efflux RND transporter periplasmic adaptor subunit [Gammaproteobacteria bacterium]
MKLVKKVLPYLVLVGFIGTAYVITQTPPQARKRGAKPPSMLSVEVKKLQQQDYQVIIDSFGKVIPKTQGSLTAQVSGIIVEVSANYNEGSFFHAGDIIVQVDPRDYLIQVEAAQAELAQTKVAFDEEVALSKQAIKDRKTLGHSKLASDFALRKPQMAAAKAKMQAASAKLKLAQLDVERTEVRAPYDGRIVNKSFDLGQMVNSNSTIAEIYSTDVAQIRLPIKNSELALINLPNNNRSSSAISSIESNVQLINSLGGPVQRWPATLVRTTASVDQNSQLLHVIAQIEQPFSHATLRALSVGQFVSAKIKGKLINHVIIIPNSAIYQGSYTYVLSDGKLERRDITIDFQDDSQSLISSGLQAGDSLVLTPLGQVSSGTPVKVVKGAPQL